MSFALHRDCHLTGDSFGLKITHGEKKKVNVIGNLYFLGLNKKKKKLGLENDDINDIYFCNFVIS